IKLSGIVGIRHRWIVHKHDQDFSSNVHAFIVIPVVFGRYDSITDEDQVRVYPGFQPDPLGPGDVIVAELELQITAAGLEQQVSVVAGGDAYQRDVLEIAAVSVSGLEAGFLELVGDILD